MSRKLLAGYWHNFVNAAGTVPLRDVPDAYDIVNVAFAVPEPGSTSEIRFSVFDGDEAQFAAGVASLQNKGKEVLLSIGGADAVLQLNNEEDVTAFVRSVSALIDRYGFDGIDIDFENGSLFLDRGDSDLLRPTTPVVANLIAALRSLKTQFGLEFKIAMAPETFFAQHGLISYGADRDGADNRAGCALPVLASLRDVISYLWAQQYNSAPMQALDGRSYESGTSDFHVAMIEMLLAGFPTASEETQFMAALEEAQVFLGVPASRAAGQGFVSSSKICDVLNYVITGQEFGGRYRLRRPGMSFMMTER